MNDLLTDLKKNGIDLTPSLDQYEALRITAEKDIPQPEPTITISGAAIASPGNITGIGGPSKAGKTAVSGVMIAGAISTTGDIDGWPEFEVVPNENEYAVIELDTEQSAADQQHNVRSRIKRAGFDTTPDYYLSYNIRQVKFDEYQKYTSDICDLAEKKFKGIHLLLIDGGADFIASANDDVKSKEIVQFFTHLAIKHNCPVIIIVHQNPGSDKERGHFGSEIQRKCYGLLTLTKEGDISTLSPKIMRKAGHGDVTSISFKYCKEKGYHIAVDAVDKEKLKAQKQNDKLKEYAETIFAGQNSFTHTESVRKIMEATGKGESTAKAMIKNMMALELIEKNIDDRYRLKNG